MRHDRLLGYSMPELLEGHSYVTGQPGTLWSLEWQENNINTGAVCDPMTGCTLTLALYGDHLHEA